MATPIRIKRSAVAGKKPTTEQLQLGELAVNFYDGKVFFKQDTQGVGIGTRIVEIGAGSASSVGKTIFVTKNGDDENTGLEEGTTAPEMMLFPYISEPATGSRIPSMSTGGAATKATIKQTVAARSVGIIRVPNQPT
jgi:hypothetical protein